MTDAQKCLGAIPRVSFPQKAGDRVRVRYAEPPLYILPENKDPVELSLILGLGGRNFRPPVLRRRRSGVGSVSAVPQLAGHQSKTIFNAF